MSRCGIICTLMPLLAGLVFTASPALAASKKKAERNKKKGDEYREAYRKKQGVVELASGLMYRPLRSGAGLKPVSTKNFVSVHYKGKLVNGRTFESSYKRGRPTIFRIDKVITGWTEALMLMKVGDKWELVIPPELAYGEQGHGRKIGPNATLIYEVELLGVR